MALNRILGNILNNDNLQRSSNLSFNSTLLFLDIVNNKVGVNTDTPNVDLQVDGDFSAANVYSELVSVGNIIIPSTGSISVGNVNITNLAYPTSNSDAATKQYVDDLSNIIVGSNLVFNNTTISTIFTSSNITMVPTGTGNLVVAGTGNISGRNITLSQTVSANNIFGSGNITANGFFIGDGGQLSNINIGNIGYKNVIPSLDVAYTLGNGFRQWKDIWLSGNIYLNGTTVNTVNNSLTVDSNVAANYFIGDGSLLSNVNVANVIGSYTNSNVANYLPVYDGDILANNIISNSMSLGGTFARTFNANTSSTTTSEIVSVVVDNYNCFNFNITATDVIANNCQVFKIIAATINGIMNYSEYGVVAIGNNIGIFDVYLSNGNISLSVTPSSNNNIQYSILVSNYL